jgi:hypothetical protein
MGIRYHIDKELGMTFVRWYGLVTANDFLAHTMRFSEHGPEVILKPYRVPGDSPARPAANFPHPISA